MSWIGWTAVYVVGGLVLTITALFGFSVYAAWKDRRDQMRAYKEKMR